MYFFTSLYYNVCENKEGIFMEVYVTIYRHIKGATYVQLNKTEEGQIKFIASLSKDLFVVDSIGLIPVED